MKVLIVESEPGVAEGTEAVLSEAGHEIVRCHVPRWQAVPCVGVDGVCPIAAGVDVAVLARNRASSEPSVLEDGIRCAIRERVPIVEVGPAGVNPYAEWTTARIGPQELDRLVDVASEAASKPNSELTAIGTEALRNTLESAGESPDNAEALVHRTANGSNVIIHVGDDVPTSAARRAAAWVASVIGRERGSGPQVDVRLARPLD